MDSGFDLKERGLGFWSLDFKEGLAQLSSVHFKVGIEWNGFVVSGEDRVASKR